MQALYAACHFAECRGAIITNYATTLRIKIKNAKLSLMTLDAFTVVLVSLRRACVITPSVVMLGGHFAEFYIDTQKIFKLSNYHCYKSLPI
jgi:hypothetical protein